MEQLKAQNNKFATRKSQTYHFSSLKENAFPVLLYIGPTREYFCEYEQCMVENLIKDEVFKELSEAGINVILGHDETHEEIVEILRLCEKYQMVYLPRYNSRQLPFYDTEKGQMVSYNDLTDDEKTNAKKEFIDYINLYKDYPAFGGVMGGDEPGSMLLPAYIEMKKVFDSICPEKLYYVNMLGPDSEKQPWLKYGPFGLSGGVAPDELTWMDVIYNYANTVGLEVMSYDNYIFYRNTIRPVLLRDVDRLRRACFHPKPIWNCILNGQEGELLTGQNKAETFYQANMSIVAGCSGLILYPGFSPIECGHTPQRALYDRKTGEKTEYYYWYKELLTHLHCCEDVLMNASYEGLIKTGVNGGEISTEKLIQMEEHLEKQGTGDSVVHTSMLLDSFGALVGVHSTQTQVLVGCYNYKGKAALYLVNNSACRDTEVTLRFKTAQGVCAIENAKEKHYASVDSLVKQLQAGEGVLYVLESSIQ